MSYRPSTERDGYEDPDKYLKQAKDVRLESVNVTRDALQRMKDTEQVAADTLNQLNSQSEHLHRAKRDLELANTHQKMADEKVSELKRLSKWIAIKNPFTKNRDRKLMEKKRAKEYEARVAEEIETRRSEAARERRLQNMERHNTRQDDALKWRKQAYQSASAEHSDLLDEEDREHEAEISANVDEIGVMASRLKNMALTMGDEVTEQNKMIGKMGDRADHVNQKLLDSQARVNRFK